MTTSRINPVRVTLARESELVTLGFVRLMSPFVDRMVVLPSRGGRPSRGADLTLHDCLADVVRVPGTAPKSIPFDGRLVTWTWNARPELAEMALANGASGVLSKSLSAAALIEACEAIHAGRMVVNLGTERLPSIRSVDNHLSPREASVIAMVTHGLDNQSIAEEASISLNSVKSCIRSAYRKMAVSSRSQAVLWGVRHGYASPAAIDEALGALPRRSGPKRSDNPEAA